VRELVGNRFNGFLACVISLGELFTFHVSAFLLSSLASHCVGNLVPGKFGWGRGYGAFSVSQSGAAEVAKYIANQEEHHRKKSYAEEFKLFVERYELKWRDD
jgi:hypothetical protein